MTSQKLKLIEITGKPWGNRWAALIDHCGKNNLELEVKILQSSAEEFPTKLKEVLAGDAGICVLTDEYSQEVLKYMPELTQEAIQLGATDVLIREGTSWWPRPCLEEAFTRVISRRVGQINFDSSALVAGASGYSKIIIGALAKAGYLTINITESSEEVGKSVLAEMKKRYFQIKFDFVPFQGITTLPGVYSLLINTIALTFENDILDELYFFNFLERGGVVMDLNILPSQTPLILEAEQWGARHLSGDYFLSERDSIMIQRATEKKIDVEAYRTSLRSAVDAVPFDASPFLKRFRERGT